MGDGFESFGLELPLVQAVREMGIGEPFPIQAMAIAPLLQGRDLMGQAHTGAGKTLAFALPMLQKIDPRTPGIQGLVIVPTRELALQVAREFEKLAKHLRVRVAAIYGGASMRLQIERLRNRSCSIIIATPGRLMFNGVLTLVLKLSLPATGARLMPAVTVIVTVATLLSSWPSLAL